jgi:hypothetical protein
MLKAGARTVAQDEASCVVYGMPKEAVKRGAVEKSVPLNLIYREILQQLRIDDSMNQTTNTAALKTAAGTGVGRPRAGGGRQRGAARLSGRAAAPAEFGEILEAGDGNEALQVLERWQPLFWC